MELTLLFSISEVSNIIMMFVGFILVTFIGIIGFGIKAFISELQDSKTAFISELKDLKDQFERMLIENGGFTTACRINMKVTDDKLDNHDVIIKEHTRQLTTHHARIGKVEAKVKDK